MLIPRVDPDLEHSKAPLRHFDNNPFSFGLQNAI
jgi:hypothetical protein